MDHRARTFNRPETHPLRIEHVLDNICKVAEAHPSLTIVVVRAVTDHTERRRAD